MKLLNPSSIHPYSRSLLPTIIGNQVWPNSWSVTLYSPWTSVRFRQKTIIGYSIPPSIPFTLLANG